MNRIDELKADIRTAEKNLDGLKTYLSKKKEELERLTAIADIKEGDYVRVKIDSVEFIGRFDGIVNGIPKINSFKTFSGEVIGVVKKWQPKKGDLCIFGDFGDEGNAVIGIFLEENNDDYPEYRFESTMGPYKYCIPFLSEKQYKEHIGYE